MWVAMTLGLSLAFATPAAGLLACRSAGVAAHRGGPDPVLSLEAMEQALVFILAPAADLPDGSTDWEALQQVQRRGIVGGTALRLFRLEADRPIDLDQLPLEGEISGARDRQAEGCQIICDAIVPHLDVKTLWLGIYARSDGTANDQEAQLQPVDRFALREAENETCWFYPTETGSYLSWESERLLELMPGHVVESDQSSTAADYRRSDVHVLWSLMADDEALTCVGLTYRRRRIEWKACFCRAEPCATWSSFSIDVMADPSFCSHATRTVFGPGEAG